MVFRKVTSEEKLYVSRLQSIAFNFSIDEKEMREKIEKGEINSDNTYGAVDTDGKVIAGMDVHPFNMWFDGNKASMGGIGGVVSSPEYRRSGNIRGIFEKVFEDLHEKEIVFSHLYPFSYDYYRKFGYEHCGSATRYTLPIATARNLPNNGTAYEYINAENVTIKQDLIEVYENFASRHNIMLSRSEAKWNGILDIPLFGNTRLYYWKNSNSIIKSWVKFEKQNNIMQIKDIAWSDNESMLGILQFMGMFDGAAEKMSFVSSPEFKAEIYWSNLYEIEKNNTSWLGMNRIVDVKKALKLMKKPNDANKFTIKVSDEFAEWNNGTYLVEYDNEESIVQNSSISDADIELSQMALVQLLLGVYDFDHIVQRSDIVINGCREKLKKIFIKKNILITDFF